jgi:HD-like signal output (HDOD) protein
MESVISPDLIPPESLQRSLLSRADELSMLPAVAYEALELAKDPDCNSKQFASVIERDVKLATDILSLANSAVFACGTPVVNLQQAIVRLGFRQCRNLILTSSAASLMKNLPLEQEWVRELLWQHSVITATTCVHLNRALNLEFYGEEFTAGLLHDLGRLLLALASSESFTYADPLDFQESDSELLLREQTILATDHCRFGAWFAEQSGLPKSLVMAILYHHEPDVQQPEQGLTALVASADHIANHLQAFEEPNGYDIDGNRGIHCLGSVYSDKLVGEFADIAHTIMAEVLKDVASAASAKGGD